MNGQRALGIGHRTNDYPIRPSSTFSFQLSVFRLLLQPPASSLSLHSAEILQRQTQTFLDLGGRVGGQ